MNEQEKLIYKISIWLKEGDSFKKMWEEFKKEYGVYSITSIHNIRDCMYKYEQKYFPKEASQDEDNNK